MRYDAFLQVTRDGIADDFICGHASDLAKALKGAEAATDKKRVEIKAPVLHAARLIDGAGKTLLDPARAAPSSRHREADHRIPEGEGSGGARGGGSRGRSGSRSRQRHASRWPMRATPKRRSAKRSR